MKRTLLALAACAALAAGAQDFDACVKELRAEATANGISTSTLDAAFAGLQPDPTVIEAMDNQPEFETPVWEYLARLVDDKRIAEGRAMLEQWRRALTQAQRRYGVDRHILVAVWGVETDYGRIMGRRSLVRSLATLSCSGARQRYFRGELGLGMARQIAIDHTRQYAKRQMTWFRHQLTPDMVVDPTTEKLMDKIGV